jgi:N-glycosylase/DNA lyase
MKLMSILEILKKDDLIKQYIDKYHGARIINQNPEVCTFSYILSSASSVLKIQLSYNLLSSSLGDNIIDDFYTFPNYKSLLSADDSILYESKIGFRREYIKNAAFNIKMGNINLDKIKTMDYEAAKSELKKIKGVGDKIADCILLYSMKHYEVFPQDRWILKYKGYQGWAQLFIYIGLRNI